MKYLYPQQFPRLVDRLRSVELADKIDDKIVWTWEENGLFFARSAYRAHFAARVEAAGATEIWKSRAPATCKFFSWLAAKKRRRTDYSDGYCHSQRCARSMTRSQKQLITRFLDVFSLNKFGPSSWITGESLIEHRSRRLNS